MPFELGGTAENNKIHNKFCEEARTLANVLRTSNFGGWRGSPAFLLLLLL